MNFCGTLKLENVGTIGKVSKSGEFVLIQVVMRQVRRVLALRPKGLNLRVSVMQFSSQKAPRVAAVTGEAGSPMQTLSSSEDSKSKRWAWAEVDLSAIRHNIKTLKANVAPLDVFAVVKADSYGHGSVPCAQAALQAGASGLCVAIAEEGLELRRAGIEAPILVFSEQPACLHAEMLQARLTATLYNEQTISQYGDAAAALGLLNVPVHLKIDTGMHRVGCNPLDASRLAQQVVAHPGLQLEGIFSHLACADSPGVHPSVHSQAAAFEGVYETLRSCDAISEVSVVHLANSAAAVRRTPVATSADTCTAVRVGIAMYGIHGDADSDSFGQGGGADLGIGSPLMPAMALKARVSNVQRVLAGQGISYGLRKPLTKDSNIATLPLGYADGVIRALWDKGHVLIGGTRRPFAGMITMDQVMVDVGDDQVCVGDEAVLLGQQGGERIIANDWAKLVGTIGYEVTCGISARVPRIYKN